MDNVPKCGYAIGIHDEIGQGPGMLGIGFSMNEFLQNYQPRDDLDKALQSVFAVLARDYPNHRLVVTASSATLETFTEVSSYLNIAAARKVFATLGDDAFDCLIEKIADSAKQLLRRNENAEEGEVAP